MIRGNSLPICAATVRSASCIAVRPASAEKSVNGSLRNSGSAISLLRVLPPVPCGGFQLLSIRRIQSITKYWICYGVLVHGERTSAATTLIAAPPTPVLVANLHLHLLLLFLGHLRHLPLLLHSGFSIPGAAPPASEECYDGPRR